jgi:hypothetical protein
MFMADADIDRLMPIGAVELQGCGDQFETGTVLVTLSISGVTCHWITDHIKMSSDLVDATRYNLHFHMTLIHLPVIGDPSIGRPGLAAIQWQQDLSPEAVAAQITPNPGVVAFVDLSSPEHA